MFLPLLSWKFYHEIFICRPQHSITQPQSQKKVTKSWKSPKRLFLQSVSDARIISGFIILFSFLLSLPDVLDGSGIRFPFLRERLTYDRDEENEALGIFFSRMLFFVDILNHPKVDLCFFAVFPSLTDTSPVVCTGSGNRFSSCFLSPLHTSMSWFFSGCFTPGRSCSSAP